MKTKLIRILSTLVAVWLGLVLADSALAQTSRGATEQAKQPPTGLAPSNVGGANKTTGAGGAKMGTAITKEEALKKYPPPKSGQYPMGERDPHKSSGVVNSPYPPHTEYDCSNIAHGGLVLDARVNKVFVRP
jgi:hypothetical protein